MVKTIPQSLKDAINENPEHYISYLTLRKIFKSKNPYREFLKQFERAFGSKQGLNLWQYVLNKYKILNELYKNEEIQEGLPNEFVGALSKKETKEFFEEYVGRSSEQQEKREEKIEKPISVSSYIREGKRIKAYKSSEKHEYTSRQIRFILSRSEYPLKQLTDEFNRAFETLITHYGIRDKRLRILGKKE